MPVEPIESRVERLFLACLSRRPTEIERQKFAEYLTVEQKEKLPERVREAMWALITSSEFRFNH